MENPDKWNFFSVPNVFFFIGFHSIFIITKILQQLLDLSSCWNQRLL